MSPSNLKIGEVSGVRVWQMPTFPDERGRLFKAYTSPNSKSDYFPISFTANEHFFTESKLHVFRGMHFQGIPHAVSKVISIVHGKATDFLFDMREASETFGTLQIVDMDALDPVSIYIPIGVAHGYFSLMDKTIISYRLDGAYCQNCDSGFSGEFISGLLPIPFSQAIQSIRDSSLTDYKNYVYSTECVQ